MADNEAKARQKMAEGRKKLSGGGGFFNKMFGRGGGAGEAADLFIQVNEFRNFQNPQNVDESIAKQSESNEDWTSRCEIECSHPGCEYVAANLLDFEQHYAQHSFQCSECGTAFDTAHRLEVHQDERHNPFFAVQVSRQPIISHFRCLHPTCEIRFSNSRTRDEHSRVVHLIDGESSRRRKANDAGLDALLSSSMGKMSMKEAEEESGWTGEGVHGLTTDSPRIIKKATRRREN